MGNYYEVFAPHYFPEIRSDYNPLKINPKSYDRDDHEIIADIGHHLRQIWGVDTSHVHIRSDHQKVTLEGNVLSEQARRFLQGLAENTLGVREVSNHLLVNSEIAQ